MGIVPCGDFSLLITAVTGGLLEAWNRSNPEQQVVPNDRIVQVNGVHSDAALLKNEIKLLHELEVKLAHDPVAIETKIKEGLQTAAKKAESSLRKTAGGLKKGLGERTQRR